MTDLKLYDAEFKFMNIVWEVEPINSRELSVLCGERLGWKRPTTYTVIRKLSERGFIKNENATVTALVKREQVQKYIRFMLPRSRHRQHTVPRSRPGSEGECYRNKGTG